ncbi:MAG: YfhO family protein, partial [Chitinophagaceae bacterium]|nr:YfhO family protein [Chitinophagaceae bacterium]
LPHFIAVVVFLVVAAIFCRPVLEGNVLNQHDIIGWKGMAQNAFDYKEKNGHFPLWNPNLFSGMPNYQVAMEGKSILPNMVNILSLWTPKPINFFFLACLCFYILSQVLRLRPIVGIFASLAYAYSTYNAVIIFAGHESQILATAFVPLLLAGLICTYEKKYWLGLALTTFGAYQQIGVNHFQITYYFFLIAFIITLFYLYKWIKEKDWKHIGIAGAITVIAAIIGVAGNALILKTTSEYTKYTMRGGKDVEVSGDSVIAAKTKGLDTAYAFEYSIGKAETSTLIMANAFGGGNGKKLSEGSAVAKKLMSKGIGEMNAEQLAQSLPKYWGNLPYTAGPAYLGVLIGLLGIIGFVILKHPLRWALLAVTLLGIFMSWGKNFLGFNLFLFENLPFYNKFRAPSMAQVIPQITICIIAGLTLQNILFGTNAREELKAGFKNILYASGGLIGLLILMYLMMDYKSSVDAQIIATNWDNSGTDEIGRLIVAGLKSERKAMFGGHVLRTIGFAILLLGTLYLYMRNTLKPLVAAIVIAAISTIELTVVSHGYLNEDNDSYVSADEYQNSNFTPSAIDQEILKDTDPDYRVFNMAGTNLGGTFSESRTSVFHKSVGGYHPAKLRIYQDIIERYLSGRPSPAVLNMLNTKYIIVANPQTQQPSLIPNPDAYGPCWLVQHVSIVDNRVDALQALGNTNLRDTVVIQKDVAGSIQQPQWDSTASIRMIKFDNDAIEYEVNANNPQFAVFSEIYYPKGWNAYLDGKQTEYLNVNYILRGMQVPAGKHTIKFVFEPESVKSGRNIMFLASILIVIITLGGLFMAWKESRKKAG